MKTLKIAVICAGAIVLSIITGAVAQLVISPPVANVNINGHTYTNSMLQSNPAGWLAGVANDVGAVTALYPQGRFSPRVPLTANLTMYVSTGGSDAANCLVGQPCLTLQRPFDLLRDRYDMAGYTVIVQVADGSYSRGISLYGKFVGQTRADSLRLTGNVATPGAVLISDARVPVTSDDFESGVGADIRIANGAGLQMEGFKLASAFRGMWATNGGELNFRNIDFGTCNNAHISADGNARIEAFGNYTISGNVPASGGQAHWALYAGGTGKMGTSGIGAFTVTLVGNPTLAYFAYLQSLSLLHFGSTVTFSGTAIGTKYYVESNSVINTSGAGSSYLPGTAAGSVVLGGVYR